MTARRDGHLVLWSNWIAHRPLTADVTGSSPVRTTHLIHESSSGEGSRAGQLPRARGKTGRRAALRKLCQRGRAGSTGWAH